MNNESERVSEVLVFECELDEPVEKVWRALTEPDLLAAWLMPNDFAPRRGHHFCFEPSERGESKVHCQVLAIEPLRSLLLSWREERERDDAPDTKVSFVLEPRAVGTLLRVTHTGEAPGLERRFSPASARALACAAGSFTYRLAA
jgi:uncharacterized protein YndB with AHSA1/START domain